MTPATLSCPHAAGLWIRSPPAALTGLAGWRGALFMAGAFTVFLGLALLVLLRRPSATEMVRIPSVKENVRTPKKGARTVLRMKDFWLIFLWFMFVIGNMFALVTMWWGGYLMQANGLSQEHAGLSISVMSLVRCRSHLSCRDSRTEGSIPAAFSFWPPLWKPSYPDSSG